MIAKTDIEWVKGMANSHPLPVLSSNDKARIDTLYLNTFGRALRRCNCSSVYADALIELNLILRKMAGQKYIMRRGVILHYRGNTYSYANITDEVAKAILKEMPDAAASFETIPTEEAKPARKPRKTTKKAE